MKKIISAVLSVAILGTSVYSVPFASAVNPVETSTHGIEMWANPSGILRRIEGVNFDDLIASYGEDAYVYRYSNNKKAIVVTPDGMTHHFSNSSIWKSPYSVVTMREGTEPPVSEINTKIGAGGDTLKVKFYRYADSNEYRFYILGEEYEDTVLDVLKNNKDVLSIEKRCEITEDQFHMDHLIIKADISPDDFRREYEAFDLKTMEEIGGTSSSASGTLMLMFGLYNLTPELYEAFMKLDNSGLEYEIMPIIAMSSGGYKVAEMAETVYTASEEKQTGEEADMWAPYKFVYDVLDEITELMRNNKDIDIRSAGDKLDLDNPENSKVEVKAGSEKDAQAVREYVVSRGYSEDVLELIVDPSFQPTLDMPARPGDLNCDGTIDVTDLSNLSLALIGDMELTSEQKMAADVDGDGAVTLADLARLRQYLSKKIESLDSGSASTQTSEPTVTPTSTSAYIEREPFPEGYIDPVNREDNPYNYATYKGNTYTKRCIHVFDETQFDEKTVNPFITKNRGGVMEFAKTVKGISSEIMFLVKCGNEEGRYFVFLNENLTEEEAKQIYDQFGITEYSTPEPLNITEPNPEQPIPTPVPTAVPTATDD